MDSSTSRLFSPPQVRWCWLGSLTLGLLSLITRTGYQIRDVFAEKSNQGILWGGDWPVLEFCNQHDQGLRIASLVSLVGVALLCLTAALDRTGNRSRFQRLGPALCFLIAILIGAGQLGWIPVIPFGVVSLGIGLGAWALLEVWPAHRVNPEIPKLTPPFHWAPAVLIAACGLAVLEILVISQVVTSRFAADEIFKATMTSTGISGLFGAALSGLLLLVLVFAIPFWNRTESRLGTVLFAMAVSGLWILIVFGPAYPAFRPTLGSFGMLRTTHELILWCACAIAALSIWGHIADLPAQTAAMGDGTWRALGIAMSPLRGLLRLIIPGHWLAGKGSLTFVPLALLLGLFGLSTYLTYWEFMDYSRALHKSTVALMLVSWTGLFLIILEWLLRTRLEQVRLGARRSTLLLVLLAALCAVPLSQASRLLHGNVEFLMVDKTELNRIMIWWLRNRWDPDRDGYSNWLGGDDPTQFVTGTNRSIIPEVAPVSSEPAVPKRLPFVLVATVETFRSDFSGAYGAGSKSVTPKIDQFASENVTFLNSYSTSNSTLPSQAALLTGNYPSRFLKKKRPMVLLETLAAAGYQTLLTEQVYQGVFLTNLGADPSMFPQYKVMDGWYAGETLPNLIAELDQRGTPDGVCAVLHLNGAHFPYKPWKAVPEADDRDRYLQCLGEVDTAWSQFIQDLKSRGWYDQVCIVLTGDHGEEFWEHGHKYHGMYIYQESVRTPILIRGPGSRPGIYRYGATTIDIVPTVAELVGTSPSQSVAGQSLAFAARGEPDPPPTRPVYLVGAHSDTYGVIEDGRWKLTFNRGMSYFELYDLAADPGELQNLIDREPQVFQRLRGLVADFIEAGQGLYTDPDPFQEGK